MILPTSFINIKVIESFFKSPIRYSYFLAKKLEGIVEQDLEHSQKTFIPDKDLRIIVKKLSKELFNIEKPNDLDIKSKLIIARKLRYDYASTVKQIARMIGLDKSTLDGYI